LENHNFYLSLAPQSIKKAQKGHFSLLYGIKYALDELAKLKLFFNLCSHIPLFLTDFFVYTMQE